MMSQAEIFAETILGMKKATKRKAYDSDSDSSIEQLTNRANKLRKKARFIHEGQLAPASGPNIYRRTIEHAGYQRDIISNNPVVVNDDGSEVDSDDDGDSAQAARAGAAEFDPYADVKIEHLLAPLTAASDLPDHPTLSKPFTSKTLTELTRNAGDMVKKEDASLWRIKHLLTRLSGDNTWIPCGSVETEHDFALFLDDPDPGNGLLKRGNLREEIDHGSTGTLASDDADQVTKLLTTAAHPSNLVAERSRSTDDHQIVEEDVRMASTEDQPEAEVDHSSENIAGKDMSRTPLPVEDADKMPSNKEGEQTDQSLISQNHTAESHTYDPEADIMNAEDYLPIPTRMRTRAQAQAASDETAASRTRSITPEPSEGFVHPYFLVPPSAHPDRNLGLPQHEADETRRLLQLYIQKQEEVVRGAKKVYEGLLKADRYRKLVMKWAKAEAHRGDMSDGEDWYDKEEWGLDEDLKKGQDEEEEDAATTAKKTRTRRQ